MRFITLEEAKTIETRGSTFGSRKSPPEQRESLYRALKNGDIAGIRVITDIFEPLEVWVQYELSRFVKRVKAGDSYVVIKDFLIIHIPTEFPGEVKRFWRYVWW